MTEPDLDKMEEEAKAATWGEWYAKQNDPIGGYAVGTTPSKPSDDRHACDVGDFINEVDAIHIANCSPPAIIAMVNDIRNLRKELAKKNTELFHAERATGCQAHEMGSIAPCTCHHEMGG